MLPFGARQRKNISVEDQRRDIQLNDDLKIVSWLKDLEETDPPNRIEVEKDGTRTEFKFDKDTNKWEVVDMRPPSEIELTQEQIDKIEMEHLVIEKEHLGQKIFDKVQIKRKFAKEEKRDFWTDKFVYDALVPVIVILIVTSSIVLTGIGILRFFIDSMVVWKGAIYFSSLLWKAAKALLP